MLSGVLRRQANVHRLSARPRVVCLDPHREGRAAQAIGGQIRLSGDDAPHAFAGEILGPDDGPIPTKAAARRTFFDRRGANQGLQFNRLGEHRDARCKHFEGPEQSADAVRGGRTTDNAFEVHLPIRVAAQVDAIADLRPRGEGQIGRTARGGRTAGTFTGPWHNRAQVAFHDQFVEVVGGLLLNGQPLHTMSATNAHGSQKTVV